MTLENILKKIKNVWGEIFCHAERSEASTPASNSETSVTLK